MRLHQTMNANWLGQTFVIDRIRWTTSQHLHESNSWNMCAVPGFRSLSEILWSNWRLRAHRKAAHEFRVFQPGDDRVCFTSDTSSNTSGPVLEGRERSSGCYHISAWHRSGPPGSDVRSVGSGKQPWHSSSTVFNHRSLTDSDLDVLQMKGEEQNHKPRFVRWGRQFKRRRPSR